MQRRDDSAQRTGPLEALQRHDLDRRFRDRSAPFRRIIPARTQDKRLARLRAVVLGLWALTLGAGLTALYGFAREGMSDLSYVSLMSAFGLLLITLVLAQSYDTRLLELMREEAERRERAALSD